MTKLETEKKLEIVENAVLDHKAEDIETLDLREQTIMTDYFVVASGTSNVHIKGIVDGVLDKMRDQGQRPDRIEGYTEAKWVLVDFGDIILHVFAHEEREFYDLETLWRATAERLTVG
jgi:ribosome-associated protein